MVFSKDLLVQGNGLFLCSVSQLTAIIMIMQVLVNHNTASASEIVSPSSLLP